MIEKDHLHAKQKRPIDDFAKLVALAILMGLSGVFGALYVVYMGTALNGTPVDELLNAANRLEPVIFIIIGGALKAAWDAANGLIDRIKPHMEEAAPLEPYVDEAFQDDTELCETCPYRTQPGTI